MPIISGSSSSGAGSIPTPVTSLPVTPANGTQALLVDSLTVPTFAWLLGYDTAVTDGFRWVFLGGSALYANQVTGTATSSATYVTLDSSTPSVTLPTSGIYEISHGCRHLSSAAGYGIANIQTNGAVPGDDNDAAHHLGAVTQNASVERTFQRTVSSIATSAAVVQVYRTDATSQTFSLRWIAVRPVRLTG